MKNEKGLRNHNIPDSRTHTHTHTNTENENENEVNGMTLENILFIVGGYLFVFHLSLLTVLLKEQE